MAGRSLPTEVGKDWPPSPGTKKPEVRKIRALMESLRDLLESTQCKKDVAVARRGDPLNLRSRIAAFFLGHLYPILKKEGYSQSRVGTEAFFAHVYSLRRDISV